MKTFKFLLIVTITIASLSVNAQNTERRESKRVTTQSTKKTNKKSAASTKTIIVKSQPARVVNNVDRSVVTYKRQKPKVVVARPNKHPAMKTVVHKNKDYFYKSGIFYRKYNNNLVKVAPPSGLRINVLPQGYVKIAINNRNYFYFEGTFYLKSNDTYIVETPPVGAIVYALPADYEKVELNGEIYFEYNGILYERVHYNGERAYQVVGNLD